MAGKSVSAIVEDALQFTERVSDTDITSSARYAENRDILLEEVGGAGESTGSAALLAKLKKASMSSSAEGTWEDMFMQAVEDAPLAVVLCDMGVPGLPLTYVNKAFEQLTGHLKRDMEGTNCRILQGQHTEQDQVTAIIRALQRAEPCQLTLTNYKKNGQEFQNLFSMKPVHDSDGVYRYTIGVQCEVDTHKYHDRTLPA